LSLSGPLFDGNRYPALIAGARKICVCNRKSDSDDDNQHNGTGACGPGDTQQPSSRLRATDVFATIWAATTSIRSLIRHRFQGVCRVINPAIAVDRVAIGSKQADPLNGIRRECARVGHFAHSGPRWSVVIDGHLLSKDCDLIGCDRAVLLQNDLQVTKGALLNLQDLFHDCRALRRQSYQAIGFNPEAFLGLGNLSGCENQWHTQCGRNVSDAPAENSELIGNLI
jgi:hypothetical protein